MVTRLFAWLGSLALSRPRLVLVLYAIILLAVLPWLLQLHLEADVRDTLPPDMARALERHNALFGTADLAFLLVQTFPGNRDTLLDFAAALHGHLTNSPLIRSVEAVIQQASDALRAQSAFRELTVQATGGYFFAAESERVIRHDIIVSVHLTLVSICALLVWALRRWGVLLYGFLPTVLGLVLALGIFAVLRSTLNALTLGCIASLIGFGMDYAVHILQRVFNELSAASGLSERSSS